MKHAVKLCSADEILPLRTRQREELNSQIVHDSIHCRPGWTLSYALELDGAAVGFGSIAIAGPWKDKPTLFEFYLLPEHRVEGFAFFEVLLAASGAQFFEAQSNDTLILVMAHTYGTNVVSEKIVFCDSVITACPSRGAVLRLTTPKEEVLQAIQERRGGGEWVLEFEGNPVGKGGLLFHYNRPYGDVHMEIEERFRRRGFGAYLVQELKGECYGLGAIPAARCSPDNVASRRTLVRAGLVPCAHILIGSFPLAPQSSA